MCTSINISIYVYIYIYMHNAYIYTHIQGLSADFLDNSELLDNGIEIVTDPDGLCAGHSFRFYANSTVECKECICMNICVCVCMYVCMYVCVRDIVFAFMPTQQLNARSVSA